MTSSKGDFGNSDVQAAARLGVVYGLAAYIWWGLVPIYFKAVSHVPAGEILAHRIIWSFVLLAILMRIYGRWRLVSDVLRTRKTVVTLLGTTVLIAVNWFLFIWAVANDQVLQASLGYFINPLLNVLLGFVFLGERLRKLQYLSIALAATGVGYLTYIHGELPWIALVLAGTFGLYGLLRKTARVESMVGLAVETMLLLPLALGYLGYLAIQQECCFGRESWRTDVLLILAGIITAVPLLWFANAARRLRLATLGFLHYITPTGHFLLAIVVYGEPFSRTHSITFVCIWIALCIYSLDTVAHSRGVTSPGVRPRKNRP